MKKVFGLLLITLFTFSCGGDGFDREAEKDKVIDVHDEVMPKLGEVMKLRKQVLAKATELGTENSETEAVAALKNLANELDEARKGMMTWMNDWAKSSKPHVNGESTVEEQKAFFAAEMERVTKVKNDINNTIAAADKALK